jgi:hypothetical protein
VVKPGETGRASYGTAGLGAMRSMLSRLTDQLRGRPEAPDQSRGRTISFRARGDTTDPHGPSNDC